MHFILANQNLLVISNLRLIWHRLVVKTITWVLLTFKESLFAVVHFLYLINLLLVEVIRFSKVLFLKISVVTSAKWIIDIPFGSLKMSLIYVENNKNENTGLWGSPIIMVYAYENFEFTRRYFIFTIRKKKLNFLLN